jgi:hypothetical protein
MAQEPTPTPVPPGTPLFSDDFSDPESGWGKSSDEKVERRYEGGEYVILVKKDNWAAWAWGTEEMFADFALEAEVRQVEGPESAKFGLVFRHRDNDNFYYFRISGSGKYQVGKQVNGEWQDIGDMKWTPSSHIKTGGATNHLKVVCQGPQIALYVNGQHLTTVSDDSFAEGEVGLIAETAEGSDPIKAAFDNFVVSVAEAIPPMLTPTPIPPGTLLFSDDFSDRASGWGTSSEENYEQRYEDGGYHFLIRSEGWASWKWLEDEYTDFVLEVDARLVDGPQDSTYGLVFRLQDGDNFYFFEVSADGYFYLGERVDDEWVKIKDWTASPFIEQGESTNRLKVVCQSSRITAYVNELQVMTVTDSSFERGRVGMLVESPEAGGTHVRFDNFEVRSPEEEVVPVSWGEQYLFSLDKNISHIYINKDGSMDVEYWLTFTCQPGYHPIDIVDIGMPHEDYDLSSVQADTGGVQLTDIRPSEYVKPGVEIHLGSKTIGGGQTDTLHVRFNIPKMVYYDDEDKSYASVEFVPTWFSEDFVEGTTYLEVNFHFPPGVTGDQTKWHYQEFTSTSLVDDRLVFTWVNEKASGAEPYQFGVSFPNQYVDVVYKAPLIDFAALGKKLSNVLGIPICWVAGVLGFFWLIVWASLSGQKRRRMKYLPPSLSVEGVGVKRGLMAVEAAILLETPLNKVLTMILFGLLKKGAVTVLSDDPLRLEVADPRPQGLREYEEGFLDCVSSRGKLSEQPLRKGIVKLVQDVNKKMKGFSRKDTAAYYRDIVSRAWQQVEGDETPEVKSQHFDEGLEWMMLDEEFEDRTERTFRGGPVFVPVWWHRYRPWASSAPSPKPSTAAPTSKRGPVSLPTLPGAAFASTIVTGMQKTADKVVSSVERFTGGVTQTTNPPPVRASASSGRSRGGGGCACACACACAGCACACAGGGR